MLRLFLCRSCCLFFAQDLSGNPLGKAGARALLPLLTAPQPGSRMQALTLLTLRACGLTDCAGALLAAALAPGPPATRRGTPGGGPRGPAGPNRGGPSAGGVAGAGSSLAELDLAENALGASTAAALGAALERNHALRRLNLSNNRIDVRLTPHAHTTCLAPCTLMYDTHNLVRTPGS